MSTPSPSGNPNAGSRPAGADRAAFFLAALCLFGVVLGSMASCGDADLFIPGSGPILPSVLPGDETPEATETPDD